MRGVPLLAAQQLILVEEIPAIVEEREVDVVGVAGDVYARPDPSEAEFTVCQNAFAAIRAAGARLVVIAGNHDSPIRLGAGAAFTAAGGLHLVTNAAEIDTPVLLEDEHGPVAIYGIPYLRSARSEIALAAGQSHADHWRAAMARVRADLAGRPRAHPGRPCFQIRSALGASTIDTLHRERGLIDAELAELSAALLGQMPCACPSHAQTVAGDHGENGLTGTLADLGEVGAIRICGPDSPSEQAADIRPL